MRKPSGTCEALAGLWFVGAMSPHPINLTDAQSGVKLFLLMGIGWWQCGQRGNFLRLISA